MATPSLAPALIRTKLYRPPLPADWVARSQLLDRLNQQRQRPLTLVSAPAGFGKSTLISAWLEQCEWRSAWLSLDDGDNDLMTFLSYLVAAVRTLFPEFGTDTQALLQAVSVPPLSVIVSDFSNDLGELDEPFFLILDDYHVIHNQVIHEFLSSLLRTPPRAWHLVMATRHDPPLPITNLRARAAVSEVRSPDLRFSLAETLEFLRRAVEASITETDAASLKRKTEGWAAGLRLAATALRLKGPDDSELDTLSFHDSFVMDYFADEILTRQPAALQDFLVKTSILDRLNGSLCEAVTDVADDVCNGQAYLEWLEKVNLFTVPLDDRREWFRYHQLFRQLLQYQLERRYRPEQIAALHQRASQWLAAHGWLEEAIYHALLAHDVAVAVQILAHRRHQLMNQDDWRRLEKLLRAFPAALIATEPELLLTQGWCAYNRYNLLQTPALIDQAEVLMAQSTVEPAIACRWQGELAFFRGYRSFWTNDLSGVLEYMQQALEWIPLEWWYARMVARLFLTGAQHMLGRPDLVDASLKTGFAEAQGDSAYRTHLHLMTCFVYWFAGDLSHVIDAANQILALAESQHHTPQTVNWAHYFLGISHYHRNQLELAEQDLLEVVLDRYETHMQCLVQGTIALAFTYQAQQREDRARATADLIPTFLYEADNTALLPLMHAFQAELALQQGRLASASQWVAQAQPATVGLMPHFFAQYLVWPKVQLALNASTQHAAIAEQLEQVRELAETRHHIHVLIEVLAVQAVCLEAHGDHSAALAVLARSIELAQPGGFIRVFVGLGPLMPALLRQLREQGVAPHFIAQILAAFAAPQPIEPTPASDSPELIEPLTPREREVLTLLAQRFSNKEIAARLFITPHTVKQHTLHIYQKLQTDSRHEAVATAYRLGLLS